MSHAAKLVAILLATIFAVTLQAQERLSASRDLYGYTQFETPQPGYCHFNYVDLDSSGTPLVMVPGHPSAEPDDRAAVLTLQTPLELYQVPVQSLVVSENGYLAVADGFEQEDGADFSNDCPLPALPDNARASLDRIHVYHDDLRAQAGGNVRHAYFPTCPRVSDTGAREACTVVEWNGYEQMTPLPSMSPLRAQVVLYHGSHQIAMQYDSVDDSGGQSATIGLQGIEARTAKMAGCNTPNKAVAKRAICYFDPRYRQNSVPSGTPLP